MSISPRRQGLASEGSNLDSSASEADVLPVTPLAKGRVPRSRTSCLARPRGVCHRCTSTRFYCCVE
jgi:hypothetical protein